MNHKISLLLQQFPIIVPPKKELRFCSFVWYIVFKIKKSVNKFKKMSIQISAISDIISKTKDFLEEVKWGT